MMARVKLVSLGPPAAFTVGGSVFYVRGGRLMLRNRVTPCNPRTAASLAERAGLIAGAKRWAYRMTEAEKQSGWSA
jgi:hypothetical protein